MQSCPAKARKKAAGPAKDRQPQCNRASYPTASLPPNQIDYSPRGYSALGEPVTLLEHALAYADLGLRVIPCDQPRLDNWLGGSGGKRPIIFDWPRRATIEDWQIHHWWGHDEDDRPTLHPDYMAGGRFPGANVGIVTGRGLVVIDVDLRHGGFETLAALEAELGPLPRDWTVRTGGGGLHIYLRVPQRLPYKLRDLGPGVEVKHTGKCVIAPPSIHESGKKYIWLSCDGEEPPRMPKSWLDKAKKQTIYGTSNSDKSSTSNNLRSKSTTETETQTQAGASGEYEHPVHLSGEESGISGDWSADTGRRLKYAAIRCKVEHPGDCNARLMDLAGSIRRIPGMASRSYKELLPTVAYWHAASCHTNEDWEGIKKHWQRAWQASARLRNDSHDTALMAYRAIMATPVPPAIAARYPDDEALQRLMALCAELERRSSVEPWYLSARKAADLLGISKWKAHGYLNQLVSAGVIEPAAEHKRGSAKAQRYRYIAECGRFGVEVEQLQEVTA